MFVIGKSKTPRCLKYVKQFPCQYRHQKKSWMTSELFEEWVRKLDRMFRDKARNIVLIIDNCPAHPDVSNLTNVKLVFLPPNTTSVLQPMDRGLSEVSKPNTADELYECALRRWIKTSRVQKSRSFKP